MPPVGIVTAQLTLELEELEVELEEEAELDDVEVLDPEPVRDADSLEKLLLERPSDVDATDSDALAVAEADERPEPELTLPAEDVPVREAVRDVDPFDDAPLDPSPELLEVVQLVSGFDEQAVATQAMTRSGKRVQDLMDILTCWVGRWRS